MTPTFGRPRTDVNPWLIAATVMLATFMEVLDTSVANVSLPHIAGNLSSSVDEATWVLTSYLVANAVVLPMSGWLSIVFGRKRFYMTCVMLFFMHVYWSPKLIWLAAVAAFFWLLIMFAFTMQDYFTRGLGVFSS